MLTTEHPERGRIYRLVRRIENEATIYELQSKRLGKLRTDVETAVQRKLIVATAERIGALGAGLWQEVKQPTDAHIWCRRCYAEPHGPDSALCELCGAETREEAQTAEGPDQEEDEEVTSY